MTKTVNGVVYQLLRVDSDECNGCVAYAKDPLCADLGNYGQDCLGGIWRHSRNRPEVVKLVEQNL